MRKNTKIKVYTIYTYDTFTKDFIYLKEYFNNLDKFILEESIQLTNKNSIYHYTYKSIEDIPQHLLNDKYLIIKDIIDIEELL